MLLLISLLACGEKAADTAEIQETPAEPTDTANEETDTPPPPPPFVPTAGHWTYSGGELIPSGTTCQLDSATEGELTDPVGFTLSNTDSGFTIVTDDATDGGTTCVMGAPDSPDPGTFSCENTTTTFVLEDVDMVIVQADIEMSVETATVGAFMDASTLSNTFTLTMDCLDVSHDFGGSCGDIEEFFPTPCTIQFSADATFDQ